jgi:hypothetical protein
MPSPAFLSKKRALEKSLLKLSRNNGLAQSLITWHAAAIEKRFGGVNLFCSHPLLRPIGVEPTESSVGHRLIAQKPNTRDAKVGLVASFAQSLVH